MKVYVIQSNTGVIMNVSVTVKIQMIGLIAKMIVFGILVHLIARVIRREKLTDIQILNIDYAKKHLIGKLVLECEDEILNTTETSLEDKKNNLQKILYNLYNLLRLI